MRFDIKMLSTSISHEDKPVATITFGSRAGLDEFREWVKGEVGAQQAEQAAANWTWRRRLAAWWYR